ncbi:MAG TPA: MarR family transcriptional regulator [Candidatus Paceibacterota bacterium]
MTRLCPLPFAQCEILAFVAEHNSPTMREIAKHFNITAPSATSLVEGLVRHKMLTRAQDAQDRRAVRLVLTAAGKRTATTLAKRKATVLGGIINKLNDDDRRDLERILRRITSTL